MLLSAPYGGVGREEIAETLWPNHDSLAADQNLRATLATARRLLGNADLIRLSGPSVVLALPLGCRDDHAFEAAARDALASGRHGEWERAIELSGGVYLPDDIYSDWTTYRRQVLGDLYRELVMRAVSAGAGDNMKRIVATRTLPRA